MAKYEKWLGAGLGWIVTGNPLGGLLGYLAGSVADNNDTNTVKKNEISDFEINLLVIASYLIKLDGKISAEEVSFANRFLKAHFDEKFADKRAKILEHCLQKEYDINVVCEQLRMYTKHNTRIQIVQFLFDLAMSDGKISEREHFFIFKIAGYLNINDVDFKRIKNGLMPITFSVSSSAYEILGISSSATLAEIRTAYRKLVLQYHPDRNNHLPETEKKKMAHQLQQVKEAYEKIKATHEKK